MKPIIEVENLSKMYHLGAIGTSTAREAVERWWLNKIGKPELAKRIGAAHSLIDPSDPQAGEEPNTFWALKDINFSLERGEVMGMIGRNGAGKSTLLKILTRITEPTGGRAIMRGKASALLEVGTGFHPELTGKENIYLNGAILGMRTAEIDRKFDDIVAFAELEKFIDTPVKRYSSGMYVRLAFSVAAHMEPDILLVDEVLSVGDIVFRKRCLGKVGEVAKEGRTVIFVSHNMAAMDSLCKTAILLDKGKLVTYGETEAVIEQYLAQSKDAIQINGSEFVFDHDPSKPMFIRKARILNEEGNLIDELDNTKSFVTEIDVEINEYNKGAYLAWVLRGPDYKVLCFSSDHDLTQEGSSIKGNGQYRARVKFPANILNGGVYSIEMLIVDRMKVHYFDVKTIDLFVINRQEFGLDRGREDQGKGTILLPLEWSVDKM